MATPVENCLSVMFSLSYTHKILPERSPNTPIAADMSSGTNILQQKAWLCSQMHQKSTSCPAREQKQIKDIL